MKLLFLTPQLPYPANSGGKIKSFRLLKHLASEHDVYACCFLKGDDEMYLSRFNQEFTLDGLITMSISSPRSFKKYIGSFIYRSPFSVYRNYHAGMKAHIESIASQFDAIFVDHFLMYQYVPSTFKGRVIVHQHNAEHVMWDRYAGLEKKSIKKALISLEAKRIRSFEKKMCTSSCAVLAAPNDIEKLSQIISRNKKVNFIETLHLGDESLLKHTPIDYNNDGDILFIGTMSWDANWDAALWFINTVFPIVRRVKPDIQFRIVGAIEPQLAEVLEQNDGVIVRGYAENLNLEFEKSSIFVAPLRFGSGIKVKVVDALYRGVPVVATSVGAEGLDHNSGHNFSVRDTAEEMANEILSILQSKERWNQLRDSGRKYAQNKLSWQSVFDNVRKAIACQ